MDYFPHHIGNVTIPTDELIFVRGVQTTNQSITIDHITIIIAIHITIITLLPINHHSQSPLASIIESIINLLYESMKAETMIYYHLHRLLYEAMIIESINIESMTTLILVMIFISNSYINI